jgi:hypothetical protein
MVVSLAGTKTWGNGSGSAVYRSGGCDRLVVPTFAHPSVSVASIEYQLPGKGTPARSIKAWRGSFEKVARE